MFIVKAVALLLAVACGLGGIFSGLYCLYYSDGLLWKNGDYTSSARWYNEKNAAYNRLVTLLDTYDAVRRGETLGYLEDKNYKELSEQLAPASTNFRYVIRDDDTGEIVLSSSGEDSLAGVGGVYTGQISTYGNQKDFYYREYSSVTDTTTFYDWDSEPIGEREGRQYVLTDDPIYRYTLEYGVTAELTVEDDFFTIARAYETNQADTDTLYWAVGLMAAFLLLTVFLMCCAGRRRGEEQFTLTWADKIPYDLFLGAFVAVICLLIILFDAIVDRSELFYDLTSLSEAALLGSGVTAAVGILYGEELLMSTAARFKCRVLWQNTLIALCLRWALGLWRKLWKSVKRTVGELAGNLPLTARLAGFGGLYLLLNAYLAYRLFFSYSAGFYLLLLCLFNGFALYTVCRWTIQWQQLRAGTAAIVGGHPDTRIDTTNMRLFPALRAHAEALNDLGNAINTAVEERMKSERMKAELITNVSHDLKTPLTSIINYVDLLKKEEIPNERAREYLEVLDRKSQRLKKLTADLVEASKASTGTLSVNPERLGMVQLTEQALGEYSEKLTAAGLTVIPNLPEIELFVRADGRHLWRILDNLLGNCAKYALPDTRVYLDLTALDGNVLLTVKNISAHPLNIPAEELMERFVRGDESRSTEGSGLGLSIARSLTELQGGTFSLAVDGDLFKVTVSLPKID